MFSYATSIDNAAHSRQTFLLTQSAVCCSQFCGEASTAESSYANQDGEDEELNLAGENWGKGRKTCMYTGSTKVGKVH